MEDFGVSGKGTVSVCLVERSGGENSHALGHSAGLVDGQQCWLHSRFRSFSTEEFGTHYAEDTY